MRQDVAACKTGELLARDGGDEFANRCALRSSLRMVAQRLSAVSIRSEGQSGSVCANERILCRRPVGAGVVTRGLVRSQSNANT